MTTEDVNWLNAGLVVLAAAAAFVAPFHLFLFAYAVLGPLHYLTEISWLHDRDYFTRRARPRRTWLALVGVTTIVLLTGFVNAEVLKRPMSPVLEIGLVYVVFAGAALAVYARHVVNAIALVILLAIALIVLSDRPAYGIAAFLLVTFIHVFVFTAAFILWGAIKTRSRAAIVSLVVYVACAVALLVGDRIPYVGAGANFEELYAGFRMINALLLRAIGRPANAVYAASGIGVMRLVAFAYTYHYLNWFSKTSIIKWHEVSRARGAAIVALWLAGVGIYLYDFRLGFAVFYVLSMLHVLLEFPLNHQTFVGIAQSFRSAAS